MKRLVFATLLVLLAGLLIGAGVAFANPENTPKPPNLVLSHVECTDDNLVEMHFVLNQIPEGASVSPMVFFGFDPFGFANPGPPYESAVMHFYKYFTSPVTLNLSMADVLVNGTLIYANNSITEYNGTYDCEEEYKTCDETTDWVLVNTTEETKPNGVVVKRYTYEKYDARDKETVCDTRVAVERIPYEMCSKTTDFVFSERIFVRTLPNGNEVYSNVYLQYDFYNSEHICGRRAQIEIVPYEACTEVTDWQFSETILVRTKPDGTDIYSDVYLKYDVYGGAVCARRAQIRIVPPETCEVTTTVYGDWSEWLFDLIARLLKRTRIITLIDFTDGETVCGTRIEVQFDDYSACESENVTVGEWSDWVGSGIDKTSYRETIDNNTGEVCNTEYRKECFGEESVHFWTDGWCSFRDRTYPDNASWMVNPPVFAQNAYCGCGYVPFGEWGIVEVSECEKDGYKYWNELTPYCGYENCE